MKLLIVDDEPHIRQMMRLTLEAAGYQIDEAASGEDGLSQFGDGRDYDVVLLDQKMPGIDGLQTLKRLKERVPDVCDPRDASWRRCRRHCQSTTAIGHESDRASRTSGTTDRNAHAQRVSHSAD
jgi:CheY-like chemotaxis protein